MKSMLKKILRNFNMKIGFIHRTLWLYGAICKIKVLKYGRYGNL